MKVFAVLGVLAAMSVASKAEAKVAVVSGAKAVTAVEKVDVTGRCACTCHTVSSKPGYGFGTTGHYGPPGQGFTPADNWRNHAAGDGLTPTGRSLPPRAFN